MQSEPNTPTAPAHTAGKMEVREGRWLFLNGFRAGVLNEYADTKTGPIKYDREEVCANAARLALCWNEHDAIVAERDETAWLYLQRGILLQKVAAERDALKAIVERAAKLRKAGECNQHYIDLRNDARTALALCEKKEAANG